MQPALPAVLDRYFAAQNAHNLDGMLACFAPDAVVIDEGRTIVGIDAIRAWKHETSTTYRITAEPLACRTEDAQVVVVVKVSGAFDGSPANLTYRFSLSVDGRITTLSVG